MIPSTDTQARIQAVFEAIDYERLGAIYCDHGGTAFFAERMAPLAHLGREWAGALARRLAPGAGGPGASLYVGAGIAEIPALVTEVRELGRRVVATNLRAEECEVLNDALARAAGLTPPIEFQATDAAACIEGDGFDHLSIVSVLDDPETFPEVSAVTYGRADPRVLDPERFSAERSAIRALCSRLVGALVVPGLITTTVEEIPWLLDAVGPATWAIADDELIDTAIVGDPIGFVRLERSAPSS